MPCLWRKFWINRFVYVYIWDHSIIRKFWIIFVTCKFEIFSLRKLSGHLWKEFLSSDIHAFDSGKGDSWLSGNAMKPSTGTKDLSSGSRKEMNKQLSKQTKIMQWMKNTEPFKKRQTVKPSVLTVTKEITKMGHPLWKS